MWHVKFLLVLFILICISKQCYNTAELKKSTFIRFKPVKGVYEVGRKSPHAVKIGFKKTSKAPSQKPDLEPEPEPVPKKTSKPPKPSRTRNPPPEPGSWTVPEPMTAGVGPDTIMSDIEFAR